MKIGEYYCPRTRIHGIPYNYVYKIIQIHHIDGITFQRQFSSIKPEYAVIRGPEDLNSTYALMTDEDVRKFLHYMELRNLSMVSSDETSSKTKVR